MELRLRYAVIILSLAVLGACTAIAQQPTSKSTASVDPQKVRLTVLYDAFGKNPAMAKGWGYAALVEHGGKRILFDTGDNPELLAQNAKTKGVDLSKLDFVVMSHRHGDHMGGMNYLLSVNPKVKIYAPKEGFGVYGFSLPSTFYRRDESLPPEQRYYDGAPPEVMKFGSAWPQANFELIDTTTEILPGIHLIALVSDNVGTLELKELSLAIDTPHGIVLLVGCSHPGIDRIVDAASAISKHIHFVAGGFHLVVAKDPDIDKIATTLRDTYRVDYVAPGHCTGEPTFAALKNAFGDRYLYAGLGTTYVIGPTVEVGESGGSGMATFDESERPIYRGLALRELGHERELKLALRANGSRPAGVNYRAR